MTPARFDQKILDQMDEFRKKAMDFGGDQAKSALQDGKLSQPGILKLLFAALHTAEVAMGRCMQLQEELQKSTRYCGVFQRALTYRKGDLVTYNGSLWACIAQETVATPGVTEGWQLAVKAEKQ